MPYRDKSQRPTKYEQFSEEQAAKLREQKRRYYQRVKKDPVRYAKFRKQSRQKYERERGTQKFKDRMADWRFRKVYGISLARRDEMLKEQGGRCALCRTEDPGSRGWQIDHDHVSGVVRGLLCPLCNLAIGGYERLRNGAGIYEAEVYVQRGFVPRPEPMIVVKANVLNNWPCGDDLSEHRSLVG